MLRHHRIRTDGSWRDTVQFAMLAHEWPQARARLLERARGRTTMSGMAGLETIR